MAGNEISVGSDVLWHSAVGSVRCEYRGATVTAEGRMACVIVRDGDAPPYQTLVPLDKIIPAK